MNDRIRSITTKSGDEGRTRLFSGEEVSKDSVRTEACGDLDELVSTLGVARSLARHEVVRAGVEDLQRRLFLAGAELATTLEQVDRLEARIGAEHLEDLDRKREAIEGHIPWPGGFVIPGATPAAAHLDLARAVARRLERRVVGLCEAGELNNDLLRAWMNRLSDYLWLLARWEEREE